MVGSRLNLQNPRVCIFTPKSKKHEDYREDRENAGTKVPLFPTQVSKSAKSSTKGHCPVLRGAIVLLFLLKNFLYRLIKLKFSQKKILRTSRLKNTHNEYKRKLSVRICCLVVRKTLEKLNSQFKRS